MSIIEIKEDGLVLARYIPVTEGWADGLKFFSSENEYEQVGTWGYDKGKILLPHSHNQVGREVLWTQEVLYIRNGKIKAIIFDSKDQIMGEIEASAGDILILLRGGHGYEILEDNTQVLEIKNGPYVGANADRRRL